MGYKERQRNGGHEGREQKVQASAKVKTEKGVENDTEGDRLQLGKTQND